MFLAQQLRDGSTVYQPRTRPTRYLLTPTSEGPGIVNLWRDGYLQRWHCRRAEAISFIERMEAIAR